MKHSLQISNRIRVKTSIRLNIITNDLCEKAFSELSIEIQSIGFAVGALVQTFPNQFSWNVWILESKLCEQTNIRNNGNLQA